ncbi:MAG: hypothetical protein SAJ12_13525 [Jaaginema sp. PMC 1079.18]|nr:hypothetical protein [Jaaginema sp. PMC 1080.18]MEC4852003.1 hypothetical protein [Jaaginema sp. PMC 1079.18]MEC4868204.1 hypothetical protein [Jaaginema sp. PMC 1078.18]
MKQPILRTLDPKNQHLVCLPGGTPPISPGIRSYAHVTAAQRRRDTPQQHLQTSLKELKTQSDRVNQLAVELESAIADFKETATKINQIHRYLQTHNPKHHYPPKICEYRSVTVPSVTQSVWGRWLLTSRRVDLHKAEREATSLAQSLRRRQK